MTLHFDVNQTILPYDSAGSKSFKEVIAHNLAKKTCGFWEKGLKEPLSYFNYIYGYKYGADRRDKSTKQLKMNDLSNFIAFLETLGHPAAPCVKEKFDLAVQRLENSLTLVLPAFYRLIAYLDAKQTPYTIILRSFGSDLGFVKKEIESLTSIRFKGAAFFKEGVLYCESKKIEDPLAIAALLKSGHYSIQDDWKTWNAHNEEGAYGKRLPLDGDGVLFFDDHISTNRSSSYNVVAPIDAHTGERLDPFPLIDQGILVPVNTLDVILNDNYFIEKVETIYTEMNSFRYIPLFIPCCDKRHRHHLDLPAIR